MRIFSSKQNNPKIILTCLWTQNSRKTILKVMSVINWRFAKCLTGIRWPYVNKILPHSSDELESINSLLMRKVALMPWSKLIVKIWRSLMCNTRLRAYFYEKPLEGGGVSTRLIEVKISDYFDQLLGFHLVLILFQPLLN